MRRWSRRLALAGRGASRDHRLHQRASRMAWASVAGDRRRPPERGTRAARAHLGGAARHVGGRLGDPPGAVRRPGLAGLLLAGLAVAEAVTATTGLAANLKWPNDVLLPDDADRKVCGVPAR